MNEPKMKTRQERREQKLRKKRERIQKHGKNLARVYVCRPSAIMGHK